ncbi:hypothetical protein PRZ48_005606 [Zasmidium cellare]|uniref:Amine oxidase n=1 Tax=Zasmidium cellare TaxID=395010 RepID=A0ABR0ELN6_ZASCE|nr:hypothetical protein PRZ48_005606 [Zasmidium cellare]
MFCSLWTLLFLARGSMAFGWRPSGWGASGGRPSQWHAPHQEPLDAIIIGGGSAGTYTAIQLQKANKSLALIETQPRLGGHVNTYIDPYTNRTIDYGVQIFQNISVVRDYFSYLDIPIETATFGGDTKTIDLATKEVVTLDYGAIYAGLFEALPRFQAQQDKYPYLDNGFNLPSLVPEDLLLPFGEWLDKYNLSNVAYTLWQYDQGSGNLLDQPVLYVLKYSNRQSIANLAGGGYIQTVRRDNQEIYDHALEKLKDSTHLSSTVLDVQRSNGCVRVLVSTPQGKRFLEAKQLVLAIPPKIENLHFLDLNQEELGIFRQFNNSYYWNALLRNTGLPDNTSVGYIDSRAPLTIPAQPSTYIISSTGVAGLHSVFYGSDTYVPDEEVQNLMAEVARNAVKTLGLPPSGDMRFEGFHSHSPFVLTVPTDTIRDGFYSRAEALQGMRNTWYTGAAWQAQDSSAIWNFTEMVVLPRLLERLG